MSFGKLGKVMLLSVIAYCLVLAGWYALHGDIVFHSDIARDFALMDQMVMERKITLIGEGIRGLPGLYHGPAWLYLNLPAFVVGQGNPIAVGWWWVVLEMLSLYSIYWVGRKIFSPMIGLMGAAIVASRIPLFSHQLFNPNGAFLLFPTFFYFMWQYHNKGRIRDLAVGSVLAGLLIQFEIMFGLPMFLSLIMLVIYKIFRRQEKLSHALILLVILLPLSTYILFDLRHNFLQLRAIATYLRADNPVYMTIKEVFLNRWSELTMSIGLLSRGDIWIRRMASLLFWICVGRGLVKNNRMGFFSLYLWVNLVFWAFSFLFPEPIKGYYFDFTAINAIIFASQLESVGRYVAVVILVPLLFVNVSQAEVAAFSTRDFSRQAESSWLFNKTLGEIIVDDAPESFSVFTLDTDIWGYSANYGVRYAAQISRKKVNFVTKSATTYLVVAKNTIDHPQFDVRWWREDQVRIKKEPVRTWDYKGLFLIEKYLLTSEEAAIPEDPHLMSTNMTLR
ncbi:MAG: hypothetical protein ABII21_04265 [bacterium]